MEIRDFLETCTLHGKIDGIARRLVNGEPTQIPIVGIKGWGVPFERKDRKSVWINGQLLSPNVSQILDAPHIAI